MKRTSLILSGLGLGALLFTAGAFGVVRGRDRSGATATISFSAPGSTSTLAHISGATLAQTITGLQDHLKAVPSDYVSWSTLGLAYVQQAKVTVDSSYYPLAEGVLKKSLTINDSDNFLAYAGLASLANARHDFTAAREFASQGLTINGYSDILYGALSDAETQLGDYPSAFAHVQKMVDLSPDTSSLSRASYTWELRGNNEQAVVLMTQALDDAPNGSNRSFALFYLGELAFNSGDANAALGYYRSALEASPGDSAALEGKAKAEAALGQYLTAIDDYATVVEQTPEPNYLIEYGELLESLGRTAEAEHQYAIFATTQALFEANGVEPDSDPTLFYANHGDPARALESAEKGISTRPFLVMYDAYAWALHVNGRDAEALTAIDTALSTGLDSALFHFHKGMIELALGNTNGARLELGRAIKINPTFSPLDVPIAEETLTSLGGGRP
jgi:tetratricopeptide (TPR) repeat protein